MLITKTFPRPTLKLLSSRRKRSISKGIITKLNTPCSRHYSMTPWTRTCSMSEDVYSRGKSSMIAPTITSDSSIRPWWSLLSSKGIWTTSSTRLIRMRYNSPTSRTSWRIPSCQGYLPLCTIGISLRIPILWDFPHRGGQTSEPSKDK